MSQTAAERINETYQRALAHQQAGRWQEAVGCYEELLALQPDIAEAHNNLGGVLHALGQIEAAIPHYQRALAIKPDFAGAHQNLAAALAAVNRIPQAVEHYRQALAINPGSAAAHKAIADIFRGQGRAAEAIRYYEKAIALKPDFAEAHNHLGLALQAIGNLEEAFPCFKRAVELQPDNVQALSNLGNCLQELGHVEASIPYYQKALALKPDYASPLNNLGLAYQALGRFDDAVACFEKALKLAPGASSIYRHIAVIQPARVDVAKVRQLLNEPRIPDQDAAELHFALAEVLEAGQDYAAAFAHINKGNRLKRKSMAFDAEGHAAFVDRLINVYTAPLLEEKAGMGVDSDMPIFIVGMPRSGSSLIEQIVAAHPQVLNGGELRYLPLIQERLPALLHTPTPYPECVRELSPETGREVAGQYLRGLRSHSATARHVTDKMLDNFKRLGLIRILFPKARIVHCRRHALDLCTSIYFQYFISPAHAYAYDLQDIALYYLAYERLMAHWLGLFSAHILDVQYEDLVTSPEMTIRRLLDSLGLEWDERCLQFHRNRRAIQTASNVQVRQPIYAHAVNRWRRYGEGLRPLIEFFERNAPGRLRELDVTSPRHRSDDKRHTLS